MKTPRLSLKMASIPALLFAIGAATACTTPMDDTSMSSDRAMNNSSKMGGSTQMNSSSSMGNIAEVAMSAGTFSTLLAAVNAAGLNDTLGGPGPITVFAPTDEAFAKLPAGTLAALLKPENMSALRQLVSYHVVSGRVPSSDLMGRSMTSPTVEGSSLMIDGKNGVMINNARVMQADIRASNGIIHSIDTVLMPANMMAVR